MRNRETDISKMNPQEYLDFIQVSSGARSTGEQRKVHLSNLRLKLQTPENLPEHLRTAYHKALKEMESAPEVEGWEDELLKLAIDEVARPLHQVLEEAGFRSGDIPIGSLPLGQLNAFSVEAPAGGRIIAVNSGLFGFLHATSRLLAEIAAVSDSSGEVVDLDVVTDHGMTRLQGHPEFPSKFGELLLAHMMLDDPWQMQIWDSHPTTIGIAATLTHSAETFVIAHEFGHIFYTGGDPNPQDPDASVGEECAASEEREFRADQFAFEYSIKSLMRAGYTFPVAYLGIDMFFTLAEILEACYGVPDSGDMHPILSLIQARSYRAGDWEGSHPPAWLRRERVRILALKLDRPEIERRGAYLAAENLQSWLEFMWSFVAPFVRQVKEGLD